MPLTAPRSGGDMLKPADCLGHLLIVKPVEFCPDFPTADYGPTDAVRCDVADLNATDDQGTPLPAPVVFRGVLWFNKILVSGLKLQIDSLVLGWMGQGTAKGKQDPPFQLLDAMSDPAAVAYAEAWLTANPHFEGRPTVASPASAPPTSTAQRMPIPGTAPATTTYTNYNVAPKAAATAPSNGTPDPLANLSPEQKAALAALGFVPAQQ